MLGLRLASVYSFPPYSLGFCGQRTRKAPNILADFLKDKKVSQPQVVEILKSFESAYPYYQLIARANKVEDPFDYRVVEAYWLGNRLLENVSHQDLKNLVLKDFCQPKLLSPEKAKKIANSLPKKAKPHHSFHILIIGSITGRVKFTTKFRDLCRIGWGQAIEVKSRKLKVKSRPLRIKNNQFYLAEPTEKEIRWYQSYLPRVEKGQVVSFHWGRACQILGKRQMENLKKYTLLNIQAANEQRK